MSTSQPDLFTRPIRKVTALVDMSFYANSDDNNAEMSVNWEAPNPADIPAVGAWERKQWQHENRKQLLSFGLEPKYRYSFLDGKTKLVTPEQAAQGLGNNLCVPAADTVFPVPSDCICSIEPQAGGAVQYLFEGKKPKYLLDYNDLQRRINQLMIVGDSKLNQFPVAYTLKLKIFSEESGEVFSAGKFLTGDFQAIEFPIAAEKVAIPCTNYFECVYHVTNGSSVKQQIAFSKYYQAVAVEMEIHSWNVGGTPAKIMYFSNDLRISLDENEIASISVLEEKTDGNDDLSYGITSNSCTVQMLNKNDRFTRNLDLLKKNRNIHPYVIAKPLEVGDEEKCEPLGRFFSEDWQLPSASNFISCKGYDILYNLQNMFLYYTLDQNMAGQYIMDGGWRGETECEACPQMDEGCVGCGKKKDNACYVFKKIFMLINKQKADSGIYGADIKSVIDPKLKNIKMNHVLIGYDTAWNILQDMANFTLSNVYVDRSGNVCVARDEFEGESMENAPIKPSKASITPSNCFTYNLPTLSKTIVNRAVVPYVEVVGGEVKDNSFEVSEKDCVFERDENEIVQEITVNLELKNLYEVITGIICKRGQIRIVPDKITLCYNYCSLQFNNNILFFPLAIELETIEPYKTLSDSFTVTLNNALSQKQNGIKEYGLMSRKLVIGKQQAEDIAKLILNNYKNGKSYIETDWQGTPDLQLGDSLTSCTRKDPELVTYECISNEFTIDGGLRVKTKARQK